MTVQSYVYYLLQRRSDSKQANVKIYQDIYIFRQIQEELTMGFLIK